MAGIVFKRCVNFTSEIHRHFAGKSLCLSPSASLWIFRAEWPRYFRNPAALRQHCFPTLRQCSLNCEESGATLRIVASPRAAAARWRAVSRVSTATGTS